LELVGERPLEILAEPDEAVRCLRSQHRHRRRGLGRLGWSAAELPHRTGGQRGDDDDRRRPSPPPTLDWGHHGPAAAAARGDARVAGPNPLEDPEHLVGALPSFGRILGETLHHQVDQLGGDVGAERA
jgi:hypothetical protein